MIMMICRVGLGRILKQQLGKDHSNRTCNHGDKHQCESSQVEVCFTDRSHCKTARNEENHHDVPHLNALDAKQNRKDENGSRSARFEHFDVGCFESEKRRVGERNIDGDQDSKRKHAGEVVGAGDGGFGNEVEHVDEDVAYAKDEEHVDRSECNGMGESPAAT